MFAAAGFLYLAPTTAHIGTMAILKIARMGHPVLGRPAEAIADPADPRLAPLIGSMLETLEDAGGVGLAAPQVHVSRRVVVFKIPADRLAREDDDSDPGDSDPGDSDPSDPDAGDAKPVDPAPTIMINPMIQPMDEEMHLGWEACLSLPGMAGLVPRYVRINVAYLSPDGRQVTLDAADFNARVIQHECDHLDGILYPQRMPDLKRFGFAEEIDRLVAAEAAAAKAAAAEAAATEAAAAAAAAVAAADD